MNELSEQLVNIERELWTNNPVFYKDNLTEDCLLVFPETGVITRAQNESSREAKRSSSDSWKNSRLMKLAPELSLHKERRKVNRKKVGS